MTGVTWAWAWAKEKEANLTRGHCTIYDGMSLWGPGQGQGTERNGTAGTAPWGSRLLAAYRKGAGSRYPTFCSVLASCTSTYSQVSSII
jgi:hypothetical protein